MTIAPAGALDPAERTDCEAEEQKRSSLRTISLYRLPTRVLISTTR